MPLPPLRFTPLLKARAWGGRRLSALGKAVAAAPAPPIGESWEIAELGPPVADGISRVADGPFGGTTLASLMATHRAALLGGAHDSDGRFPLLVKYLDAAEHLSVQVHPTAAYAAAHPGSHLKTEAWFVVAALPGAAVYRGIRADVTPNAFRRAIADGTAVDCLLRVPVAPGDFVPLESGLCHALGAGVLVAEVQTPSDTTFRVFDWHRNDPARPLHVEQAMECTLFGRDQRLDEAPILSAAGEAFGWSDGLRIAPLCSNRHFTIESLEASPAGDASPVEFVRSEGPTVLMVTRGEAVLDMPSGRCDRLEAGNTVLFPSDTVPTRVHLAPTAVALRVTVVPPILRQDAAHRTWKST